MTNRAISRRGFLARAGLGAAAAAGGTILGRPGRGPFAASDALGAGPRAVPERPNILLIMIDDLGWKDLSCMGSTYYHTPRIDALAQEGMVFTDAYASAPVCAPSRACLMSGQYSPRHGVFCVWRSNPPPVEAQKVVPPPNTRHLEGGVVTVAERLGGAGYATAHVGKWHLGDGAETGPEGQGFDVNVAGSGAGMPKTYFSPYNMKYLTNGPKGEYLPDRLTDEAVAFLKKQRAAGAGARGGHPFFLDMSYYTVHCLAAGKLEAKAETIAKYRGKPGEGRQSRPEYAAMVELMDENVGRLLDALEELGLADETLVIFTSDNGGWGPGTDSRPLRGQKGQLYEGGIRVPMIVRWPGKVRPGSRSSEPIINVDFYPTFLELTSTSPPKGRPLDGESLVPLLTGKVEHLGRDAIFWHFPAYAKRWPDNTTLDGPFITRPVAAVRVRDWKLLEFFEDGRLELYNLREDPGESRNLADAKPEKARELHEVMLAWRRSVNAPAPSGANPAYDPNA